MTLRLSSGRKHLCSTYTARRHTCVNTACIAALRTVAGLSSMDAVQLTASLEQALGRELPPTLAFDYPTVDSLVAFLAGSSLPDVVSQVPPQQGLQHRAAPVHSDVIVAASGFQLPGSFAEGNSWDDFDDRCRSHDIPWLFRLKPFISKWLPACPAPSQCESNLTASP